MLKLSDEPFDLNGYHATATPLRRGRMTVCEVRSEATGETFLSETLEAADCADQTFESIRKHWYECQLQQPLGSLKQVEYRDSGHRLRRVIEAPVGVPLQDWICTRTFEFSEVLETATSMATALADWHRMSRIHGKLGGECIFRSANSTVKLRDAAVGNAAAPPDFLSLAAKDVAFLSPESSGSLSRQLGPASDLYSVGVVLFAMLTGRLPIQACSASDYLDRQLCVEPARLREVGLDVPQAFDDLVARLLNRDPRDRYQTASALLFDLQHFQQRDTNKQADAPFAIGTRDLRQKLTEATLVGRAAELAQIDAVIRDAKSGSARFEVLCGAEAVCRRSFLDEVALRIQSQGMLVFRGGGSTTDHPKPLQSLEPVLARVVTLCQSDTGLATRIAAASQGHAETLGRLLPSLAHLWPSSGKQAGPRAYGSKRAEFALEELFVTIANQTKGAALLFDDLETVDPLTLAVVRSLAQRIKNKQAKHLLCMVSRDAPTGKYDAMDVPPIRLKPVSYEGLKLHLESTAGRLSDPIKRSIIGAANGSPVMASAILGRMIVSKAVSASRQGWVANGPLVEALREDESIAEVLERQLHSLSGKTKQILATAAVIGQYFELGMLTYVADVGYVDVLEVATDAQSRRLLWRDAHSGRFQFAHDRIRAGLAGSLDQAESCRLHLRAAAYLEQNDPGNVFDLAHHYHASGQPELALRHALDAARQARQRFSLAAAQDQLEIAQQCVTPADRQLGLEIFEGLGEIHLLSGRYQQAETFLCEALTLAASPLQRARVQQQIGELSFKRGRFAQAANEYEQALAMLGGAVPRSELAMLAGLVAQAGRQFVHSLVPASWIIRRQSPTESNCLRLQLLSRLSHVYWFSRGKLWTLGSHLRSLNEAETFAPCETLAAVYSEHGPVMSLLRWFARANRYAERSLSIRTALDDLWGQGQSLHYHAVVMLAECRFGEAHETAARAVELLHQTGDFWEVNMARYQSANALYRSGRLADAAEQASLMYYSGREIGDAQAAGISLDVWARAVPQTLSMEIVEREAARARPDAQSHAQTQLAYAVMLLHHQRVDEAIAVLREAIQRCRRAGHLNTYISPCYAWLGTALRHRLEATDRRDGRRFNDRLRIARRTVLTAARISRGFPADRAQCHRELAILDAVAGKLSHCKKAIRVSLAAAQKCGQPVEELRSLSFLKSLHEQEPELLGGFPSTLARRLARLHEDHPKVITESPGGETHATNLSLADRFVTLLYSGRRIAQALSADVVYAEASEAARRLLHGQSVDLLSVRRHGGEVSLNALSGASPDRIMQQRIEDNMLLIKSALAQGAAVRRGGQEDSAPIPSGYPSPAGNVPLQGSAIATPIAFRGEFVAVILVTHEGLSDLFGSDELRIAEFVSTLAGAALENADGFLRLKQLNETLEQRVKERTQAAEDRAGQLAESNQQLRSTEEQLREAIVQAHAASEAKSRFLATMSHEIRTPLNGILGMTRLARQSPAGAQQSAYLNTAEQSGQSLLTLINDLLDFSKLEAGKMELERIPIDLRQLIDEVSRLMSASAWQKDVELLCQIDPPVPTRILGDPSRLRQIMMNLLGNAIKFTAQGFISLSVRTSGSDALPCSSDDGIEQLVIIIQDSGIGIAADKQAKIFESFSQADSSTTRQYGGSGLGLAICRELIEMMGGTIEIHSQLGVGSTFTVRLPLHVDHTAMLAPAPPTGLIATGNPLSGVPASAPAMRILVAEDGRINQEVMVGILQMRGYQVELAEDGIEAVARSAAAAFDLCLMDVDMPNMDGIEATKAIRAREQTQGHCRLPIVAMTAHSGAPIAEACKQAGMDAHLTKPIEPEALFREIERLASSSRGAC